MIPLSHPLAQVQGAFNAVYIEGDLVGPVLLHGQGAGGRPTASAVVGDLIDAVHSIRQGTASRVQLHFEADPPLLPMADVVTRAYLRVVAADRPGVLAAVGQVFADEGVSIASMIQKDTFAEGTAELVFTTHPARDEALERARDRIGRLDSIDHIASFLRVI